MALGIAAGIIAALLLGRAIRGLLFEVSSRATPPRLPRSTVILFVVGAIACLVPARRATGPNTVDALRLE